MTRIQLRRFLLPKPVWLGEREKIAMSDPIIHPNSQSFFRRKRRAGDAECYATELQRLIDQYSVLIQDAEIDARKAELDNERREKVAELKAKYGKDDNNPYCLY